MAVHPSTKRADAVPALWRSLVLVWVVNSLLFFAVYQARRWSVFAEVRNHVRDVATAVAEVLPAEDLEVVQGPADVDGAAFARIQQQLGLALRLNPELLSVYTMRRPTAPFSSATAYAYVVDEPARDRNRDGRIGPDEQSMPPGQPYDAQAFPAMVEAWERPSADRDIASDPPFPDSISGYAPVRRADGRTVAIVGVDLAATTIHRRLRVKLGLVTLFWMLTGVIAHYATVLYHGQFDSRDRLRVRNRELSARNELLRRALHAPEGPVVPRAPQVVMDRYDVVAATAGGGVFRLFELDEDHLGFLLADLQPGSPSAALVAGAMDLLVEHIAVPAGETMASILPYADPFQPGQMLRLVGRMLADEFPPDINGALVYGLLDFRAERWTCASLGCPPLMSWAPGQEIRVVPQPEALPLRAGADVEPAESSEAFSSGSLLLVAGPGRGSVTAWQGQVQSAAQQVAKPDPLALLTLLTGRPVAALLIR